MTIPRTSASQYELGKAVKQSELKQGDLVFYATGKKGKYRLSEFTMEMVHLLELRQRE